MFKSIQEDSMMGLREAQLNLQRNFRRVTHGSFKEYLEVSDGTSGFRGFKALYDVSEGFMGLQ